MVSDATQDTAVAVRPRLLFESGGVHRGTGLARHEHDQNVAHPDGGAHTRVSFRGLVQQRVSHAPRMQRCESIRRGVVVSPVVGSALIFKPGTTALKFVATVEQDVDGNQTEITMEWLSC